MKAKFGRKRKYYQCLGSSALASSKSRSSPKPITNVQKTLPLRKRTRAMMEGEVESGRRRWRFSGKVSLLLMEGASCHGMSVPLYVEHLLSYAPSSYRPSRYWKTCILDLDSSDCSSSDTDILSDSSDKEYSRFVLEFFFPSKKF
jgi:hypothetical protein